MKIIDVIKRLFLCLLAVSMILGIVSCKKKDETGDDTTDAPVEDISFLDYTLIRPDKASERLMDEISTFYGRLMMLSGVSNPFNTDYLAGGAEPDANAKEILIGHTNRPETQQVLSEISNSEFAVAVIGNKIVITGKTDSVTVAAVKYFINTYLKVDSDGILAGDLFHKENADVAVLVDSGTVNCELVRPDNNEHMNDKMLKKLYNIIRSSAGVAIPTVTDKASTSSDKIQILFGYTDCAETAAVREQTQPEDFTIDFIENKIVIFAYTAEAMQKAVDAFSDILAYSCYTADDGKVTLCVLKEKLASDKTTASYYKEVPFEAKGIKASSIYDAYDNTMMLYWNAATAEMYSSYVAQLESLGFAKYQVNPENDSIVSATYIKDKASAHVYYLKRTSELRVITQNNATLPVNPYSYEKVCDVSVTQLGLDYTTDTTIVGGMGYLIRLADGTFVVIDGGDATAGKKENKKNAENLYELMLSQKPQNVPDIVISAWIVTHPHADHYGVYNLFAKYYTDKVSVKMLVGNDLSDFIYENLDGNKRAFNYSERSKAFDDCVYFKIHTGQSLYFPGITFNALYTHEDVYPNFMLELNSGATIVVDAVVEGEEDTRIIFFADLTETGAGRFFQMYKDDVKCDIIQVGHHGNKGGSYELYSTCDPDIALWPAASHYPDMDHIKGQSQNKWLFDNVTTIIRSGDGNYTISFGEKISLDDNVTGSTDDDGDYTQRY